MKKQPIENKIYAAIIGECENLEAKKTYRGNGHHLAQRLTEMVSIGLLPKQQRQIFDALTKTPTLTRQVAQAVKIESKQVSAVLNHLHDATLLVHFKTKGKLKLWYK